MGARLVTNENEQFITMMELKDGELAVIVDTRFGYAGRVVQRYKEHCVPIGRENREGWTRCENVDLLVRVLKPGELIEVF
jgi:hypothetical protein